tara:strand:- start:2924 stop:3754 length:831 start_codon:yes stop_codon:yes gene_type:complete
MKNLDKKVVAITGAGSGIGRSLAIQLSQHGSHLALSDNNQEALEQTKTLISSNVNATTHIVDVANQDEVYAWADNVAQAHNHIDCIINNAGVTVRASIEEINYEDFNWVFDIVFFGVLYGTKAFLPYLKESPDAHIVNISSVNGFTPFPKNGPYNCAKHAVKALNQTLHQELRGSNINITSVHPGGIQTNIARNMKSYESKDIQQQLVERFEKAARTSPDKAANIIIKGILKNRKRLLVGFDASIFDILNRLFPQRFADLFGFIHYKEKQKMIMDD